MKFTLLTVSALCMLTSATRFRSHNEVALSENVKDTSYAILKSSCEKEDEDDCTAYCKGLDATSTCTAAGNKITCFCKGSGGGKGEDCESRCLLCMPGKSAMEEVKGLFEKAGSKIREL